MEEDCDEEYIEFFDGLSFNATNSLGRFCGSDPPSPIGTTGVQARVVFHSSEEHPESLSGVRVTYSLGLLGKYWLNTCTWYIECLQTIQGAILVLVSPKYLFAVRDSVIEQIYTCMCLFVCCCFFQKMNVRRTTGAVSTPV